MFSKKALETFFLFAGIFYFGLLIGINVSFIFLTLLSIAIIAFDSPVKLMDETIFLNGRSVDPADCYEIRQTRMISSDGALYVQFDLFLPYQIKFHAYYGLRYRIILWILRIKPMSKEKQFDSSLKSNRITFITEITNSKIIKKYRKNDP